MKKPTSKGRYCNLPIVVVMKTIRKLAEEQKGGKQIIARKIVKWITDEKLKQASTIKKKARWRGVLFGDSLVFLGYAPRVTTVTPPTNLIQKERSIE